MTLGDKIKFGRKKIGLSKEDFASILNISLEEVESIENNELIPDTNEIVQISNVLDLSLDYLLKDNFINKSFSQDEDNKESETGLINIDNKELKNKNKIKLIDNCKKDISNNRGIRQNKFNVIRVWMIIGTILTPLVVTSSMIYLGPYSLLCLALYFVSIPLCIYILKIIKNAKNRNDLIEWGIISLFLISVIGGILILTLKDEDFGLKTREDNELEETERIKKEQREKEKEEKRKLVYEEKLRKEKEFEEKLQSLGFANINHAINKTKKVKVEESIKQDAYNQFEILMKECKNIKNYDDLENFNKKVKMNIPKRKRSKTFIILNIVWPILLVSSLCVGIAFYIPYYQEQKALEESLKKEKDYKALLYWVKHYDGWSYTDDLIEQYILELNGYKDVNEIEKDYIQIKKYIKSIDAKIEDIDLNNLKESVSSSNITYLKRLYSEYCNNERKWNFDRYIKTIAIPKIMFGIQFTTLNDDSNFKWYTNDGKSQWISYSDNFKPNSTYDFEYFFNNYDSKSNELNFYLKTEDGKQVTEIFSTKNIHYDETYKNIAIDGYVASENKTYTFYANSNTY